MQYMRKLDLCMHDLVLNRDEIKKHCSNNHCQILAKKFHGCSDVVFHLGQKTYQIHFGIFSSECPYLEGKTS